MSIYSIENATAIAAELVGKRNIRKGRFNTNLHTFITGILSSKARVNAVKGNTGAGKEAGAEILSRYLQTLVYDVVDISPDEYSDNYMIVWHNAPKAKVKTETEKRVPDLEFFPDIECKEECPADALYFITARQDVKDKIWIIHDFDKFSIEQKSFLLKSISELNLRAVIISECEMQTHNQSGKLFVTPIY